MAHYAFINSDNIVVKVISGVDENIIQTDIDGTQVGGSTESWEQFYASRPWFEGLTCKRTSYNAFKGKTRNSETNQITNVAGFRKNFAGIGMKYDEQLDAFIDQQPYPSWILNETTFEWEAPTPYPTVEEGSDEIYTWDENTTSWLLLPPSN